MARERAGAYPVVFLTVVVLISVAALTSIDAVTKDKILAAQREEIKAMLETLFPEMDDYVLDEASGTYTILGGGAALGSALMAGPTGYGGRIDILVGLDPDGTLRGIRVISQQETPGLGARIVEAAFLDQFVGLSMADVALRKEGGSVDAITGATISSSAVVEGVRKAVLQHITNEGGGR